MRGEMSPGFVIASLSSDVFLTGRVKLFSTKPGSQQGAKVKNKVRSKGRNKGREKKQERCISNGSGEAFLHKAWFTAGKNQKIKVCNESREEGRFVPKRFK